MMHGRSADTPLSVHVNANRVSGAIATPPAANLQLVHEFSAAIGESGILGVYISSRAATRGVLILAIQAGLAVPEVAAEMFRRYTADQGVDFTMPEVTDCPRSVAHILLNRPPRRALRYVYEHVPSGIGALLESASELTAHSLSTLVAILNGASRNDPRRRYFTMLRHHGVEITDRVVSYVDAMPTDVLLAARRPLWMFKDPKSFSIVWRLIQDGIEDLAPVYQSLAQVRSDKRDMSEWLNTVILRHLRRNPEIALPNVDPGGDFELLVTGKQLREVRRLYGWCLGVSYATEILLFGRMIPILWTRHRAVGILYAIGNNTDVNFLLSSNVYGPSGGKQIADDVRAQFLQHLQHYNPGRVWARLERTPQEHHAVFKVAREMRIEDDFDLMFRDARMR